MAFSTSKPNIKITTGSGIYYIIKEAKNYSDAKAAAESEGGHLAVFETEAEYTALYNAVATEYANDSSWGVNTTGAGNGVYLRIGGTDGDTVSRYDSSDADWNWKWVSNNSEIAKTRTEWGEGTVGQEPDNFFDGNNGSDQGGQDSLVMGLTGWGGSDKNKFGDAGEWNDERDSIELYYLVEEDNTAPTVESVTPADDSTNVPINSNFTATFSENVKVGTGNITLYKSSDDSIVESGDVTGAKVTGSGTKTLTFELSSNLEPGTSYYTLAVAGIVTDLAGNPYAGHTDKTKYNFTTAAAADTTAPTVLSRTPSGNSTNAAVDSNLVATFSENIVVKSGNIDIVRSSDDSLFERIDITSAQITGSGTQVLTLNPNKDFEENTTYYVQVAATAIDDTSGNSFAGISDKTSYVFTTAGINPTISSSTPADDAIDFAFDGNIILNFSEIVDAESGNIIIYKTSDDSICETIDVTSSKVTGSGTKQITINPASDLASNTEFYIKIASTAFDDAKGNSFAGISDKTSLSFKTAKNVTYTVSPSSTTLNEGETLTTKIITTDVDENTRLYWDLTGTNINEFDLSSGNKVGSSLVGSDGTLSITHTFSNDFKTEGSETLNFNLYSDKDRKTQIATKSITITDTSKYLTYTDSSGNESNDGRILSSGSNINESITYKRLDKSPAIVEDGFSTTRSNIKITTSEGTYYIIKEAKNYSDAKAAAESDGGFLASFETEAEYTALYNAVATEYANDSSWGVNTTGAGNGVYLRIGGTDGDTVSRYDSSDADWNWKWVSNNSEIAKTRTEWGEGTVGQEPDNFFDGNNGSDQGGQDSLVMGLTGWGGSDKNKFGDAGEWNDERDSQELYYLVETKKTAVDIGKTGINFSTKLDDSALNDKTSVATTLTPLLDGLTTAGKNLAYFTYTEKGDGSAPTANTFTYDPIKKAGAKFYDLNNDSIADTVVMEFVDGGYGDKDGTKDGTIVDPSTAGVIDLNPVFTTSSKILTVADDSDLSPAAINLNVSITKNADTVNQIGYLALNSSDSEILTYELIKERGTILFSNVENTDTPKISDMNLTSDISLINNQKLVFFEVVDTTLESLLANNTDISGFGSSFKTLNLSDATNSSVNASNGGNTIAVSIDEKFSGINDLIASDLGFNPIIDFTSFADLNLEGSIYVAREATFDSSVGFYKIQNADGAVLDPITGNLITPGTDGYSTAALDASNLFNDFGTLSTEDDTTITKTVSSFSEVGMLAPYASIKDTGETFFAFSSANSDSMSHFREFGNGTIGLEDIKGGGDQDYDDLIFGFDLKLSSAS